MWTNGWTPFGGVVEFSLRQGDCVWLQGPSGRGKTSLAMFLAGLKNNLTKLHVDASVEWDESLSMTERCGVLFQQTTLLDELTISGNLTLALKAAGKKMGSKERDMKIKHLLESVGLDFARDQDKMPTELSGGMGRRASLAMLLAQDKHVIVLDEPFSGLDYEVAVSVAKTLAQLRKTTALLLISHEPEVAKLVLQDNGRIVQLEPPKAVHQRDQMNLKPNVYGVKFHERFFTKLKDYALYSLPLILTGFAASSLAIAMLSADTIGKIDVSQRVLAIVDEQVPPMIKMLTGEEPSVLHKIGVRMKVQGMLNETVPPAKAAFYAIGMAKLFVLELGPLLTALLLTGRLGGSYAGQVATLQATAQAQLLQTLGVNPRMWSLWPAVAAAVLAGPFLATAGTFLSLVLAGYVGSYYKVIPNMDSYWENVRSTTFPDFKASTLHGLVIHPPIFHLVKTVTFSMIIMGIAEACVHKENFSHRKVPMAITKAVVLAGLSVIVADWGFSRLLVY